MHVPLHAAGLALMYLGSSLLLSRLSAEAANIRSDVNLLWTNKFDRCGRADCDPPAGKASMHT